DLLEAHLLPAGARDQLVAGVHIGLVMDVVMELERLLRHALRGERIVRVGKIGEFESHLVTSLLVGWGAELHAVGLYRSVAIVKGRTGQGFRARSPRPQGQSTAM